MINISKAELRRKKKDLVQKKSDLGEKAEKGPGDSLRNQYLQGRIKEVNEIIDWINLLLQTE